MTRRLRRFSLIIIISLSLTSWVVHAESWGASPYAYDAQQVPLDVVLKDFANAHGFGLQLNGVEGSVDLKLRAPTARDFLERLAREYQFQWFVFNSTLYISPRHAQTTHRLEVSEDAAPDLKEALTQIGLLDARFGWGEMADERVVLVTGPKRYVELVQKFSVQRAVPKTEHQIMMFTLQHTTVSDRVIKYREQNMTMDGVATILRKLLNGESPLGNPGAPASAQAVFEGLQKISDSSQSRLLNLVDNQAGARDASSLPSAKDRRVVADVRNNAVLIYDSIDKRDFYQRLINRLDVPAKQIEIDAVIVDIDRHQLERLGSNWSVQRGGASFGASLLNAGTSTLQVQDVGRFFARIQALEGQGLASIVARPSVLTLDNQPAVIDFSRTQYITVTGERVSNIQPVTAGTSLQVIPRLVPGATGNQFHLIIDIEDGQLEQVSNQATPSVKRGTVSTQAVISEARSLVIGGFQGEERNTKSRQVPVLGKLPLVGALFTSNDQETLNRERLFILTPRLKGVDPAPVVRRTGAGFAKPLEIKKVTHPNKRP
ncbi:type III secretion system outer membrane ring subunit SctC [Pseudomonas fluorescens]|uniref:type III secretion system outer membrane ring subunit SctC n=1 Tax=Pseudomonas fluorescens TaxID=294 RepID=UPI001BEC6054|nr:type III secretion system outer membrane ring subunit SctC [Pseudomonas fluorescens]MBT2375469.1 type III secretion system outer membrane ring subunit SctC [Pseudomonas fluorescens]